MCGRRHLKWKTSHRYSIYKVDLVVLIKELISCLPCKQRESDESTYGCAVCVYTRHATPSLYHHRTIRIYYMFWVFSLSAAAAEAAQYAAAATHNRVGTYNVTHIVFSLGHLYVYREFRCLYSMVTLSLSVGSKHGRDRSQSSSAVVVTFMYCPRLRPSLFLIHFFFFFFAGRCLSIDVCDILLDACLY